MGRQDSVKVAQFLRAQKRADARLILVTQAVAEYNAALEAVTNLNPLDNAVRRARLAHEVDGEIVAVDR